MGGIPVLIGPARRVTAASIMVTALAAPTATPKRAGKGLNLHIPGPRAIVRPATARRAAIIPGAAANVIRPRGVGARRSVTTHGWDRTHQLLSRAQIVILQDIAVRIAAAVIRTENRMIERLNARRLLASTVFLVA